MIPPFTRTHLGTSAHAWQTSAKTTSDWISADPISEMRIALDQALGDPSPSYAAGLAQGQSILAAHIQELRNRVLAAWINSNSTDVRWLVADQLGTPRMIFDQTGAFSSVSRHDYLPFGEEIYAGTGGRTTSQGYSSGDGARQKFTQKERDNETGLDYFAARYDSSTQGRFTSIDTGPFTPADPQNFNRYSYVQNNPLKFVDPSGRKIELTGDKTQEFIDYLEKKTGLKLKYTTKNGVTTITGSKTNKDFKGEVNKEFAKTVKDVAGAGGTAKFNAGSNMTNQQGSDVFMDDNGDAWESRPFGQPLRAGNVDVADVQSLDSQAPELGMAMVGHFLIEGLEMRTPGANFYNTGTPGAHDVGLEAERKILSEATGSKQATRYQPPVNGAQVMVGTPFSFVYSTVQYDITVKSSGVAVSRVTPPTTQRPKK